MMQEKLDTWDRVHRAAPIVMLRVFNALDTELPLAPGASHKELSSAMEGHILDQAELAGMYAKKSVRAA